MKENEVTQRVYTDDNGESLNDSSLATLSAMTKDEASTANRKRSGLIANQSTLNAQIDARDRLSNVTNKANEYDNKNAFEIIDESDDESYSNASSYYMKAMKHW